MCTYRINLRSLALLFASKVFLNLKNAFLSTSLLFSLLVFQPSAYGEQKKVYQGRGDIDTIEVHYMVLNSTEIPKDIAKHYDLKRSSRLAFINISVLQMRDPEFGSPIQASIEGVYRNLLDQRHELSFKEVKEQSAIYYLAQFPFDDQEMYRFNLNITPLCPKDTALSAHCSEKTLDMYFSQKLYFE